jgi:ATP/maltotriose-dependent transcriptional regulator MalT
VEAYPSAPVGYEKNTLTKCCPESLDSPCARVSLDERDDDLVDFLSYFQIAIQSISPGFGDDPLAIPMASPLDHSQHRRYQMLAQVFPSTASSVPVH